MTIEQIQDGLVTEVGRLYVENFKEEFPPLFASDISKCNTLVDLVYMLG